MSRELFGTDGVRGLAGQYPLDEAGAVKIGRAVGSYFAKPGQTVVIGGDTRESSAGLVEALSRGLTQTGANVCAAGVIPTPGLAYVTREGDFAAGVMVTASHNPYQYNGVKVFDARGGKLPDKTEAALNDLIEHDQPAANQPAGQVQPDASLLKRYEDFLVGSAAGLQLNGRRLAIDTANGAASGLAGRVFTRLGAAVTPLFDQPDGRNINAGCGATDTAALREAVTRGKLDLGLALDGDADRLMMVDGQGREVNGDHLLYLLAVSGGLKGVVATVMTNLGAEQALAARGIKLERVQVGDRYVLEGLKQTGFALGGEQSGHIIFPKLLQTGDGLLAAVQTLKALTQSGRSLADWRDAVPLLPQAVVNITLHDKTALERPAVQHFIEEQTAAFKGQGRLLVRPSGTEPLARVMVEAPGAPERAAAIAAKLEELLKS